MISLCLYISSAVRGREIGEILRKLVDNMDSLWISAIGLKGITGAMLKNREQSNIKKC